MLNYETILKDAANVPQGVDLREEVAKVVSFQKEKMENGQWTFQWNDKPQKVRDIVHRSKLPKYAFFLSTILSSMFPGTEQKKVTQLLGHCYCVDSASLTLLSLVLKITDKSASLISMGMAYAPPFVSLPWAAIGAILPVSPHFLVRKTFLCFKCHHDG